MADSRLRDLWAELSAELHALRVAFPPSVRGFGACTWFDEFLGANEFGLALETLCDCLIESDEVIITPELLETVSRLHAKMGVDDACATLLRRKCGLPG